MKSSHQGSSHAFSAPRRSALKKLGGLAAASMLPMPSARAAQSLKIGYVSPQTGPLAVFAEPDPFTLDQVRGALASGIKLAGKPYAVEILYKDSQSSSNRAADVTSALILEDKVDLVVAASTPATTNPVADQCELNGVPCVTTDTPWQPHFFGRGGDPKQGFEWTWHYFWGLEDIIGVFTSLWEQIPTRKTVGSLWPNDSDGNAWGDAKMGFPPVLAQKGFELVDQGRYQTPSDNFSAYINAFKSAQVDIVTGVVPPPDFANFWAQSGQQDFRPRIVTVAKACEFPAAIESFGARAEGLSVEVWWSPAHPFASSLTGQSSAELAQAFTAYSGRPWTMPLGFKHSLFEVAVDVFKRAAERSPEAIRDAIRTTRLDTVVGPIDFASGPVPNVCKTPLVGGQWQRGTQGLDLRIVENSQAGNIAVQGRLEPIRYA
ncbi:putative ABC transporter substrate-binding protein [Castellaniella defragrans 65Phen]|uniref:Putative ABC transporter substrate-binding protein n=1 Tax=Castellaniella defragrans (strain DSM 12143 / CCUG 39792 / 65Phen) TaxID=1437824 RepID=W8X2Q4_CASD6|nr:ABC transporter substrate-binding protein [Castellaniella defragrans]CDM23331.1 putative ABC transporter substrate-binding protein [Castellaniella defragrans 65Phen]